MNFYIDKYDEITYVQLLSDLREGATSATSPSYNYFLNLLLGLLNGIVIITNRAQLQKT